MSDFKPYLEQLLVKHRINVSKHHIPLMDSFVKDELNIESFNLIRKAQLTMIDKWKEKTQIEDIKTKLIVLNNGTVGKPYEFILDFAKLELSDLGDYELEFDKDIGVVFTKEENKLSGVLKKAGEHILYFNFKLKSEPIEKPFHKKEIKLIANPDPRSLWKNEPTPTNIDYYKKDSDSGHFDFGSKKLVVASKRGRSHAHEAKPRDDDFDFRFDEQNGWGIIAVADGAGASKFSRKGSQIACNSVLEYFDFLNNGKYIDFETDITSYLADKNDDTLKAISAQFITHLGSAALLAQNKIREEATAKGAEIKDYSTTLIFVLIKKYDDQYVIAAFWVGDGGIGIYNKEKSEVFILGTPDSGEFAGQTRFLTMGDIFTNGAYANRVKFKVVEDFTSLVLMTDGITDPKFQTDNNLGRIEKWNELWADLEGENKENSKVDFSKTIEEVETSLMNWLDFWSPGNHDDRTIAILY
jgi:serine/threonine protein phosphatase PrpC